MTSEQAYDLLEKAIRKIAPDADLTQLKPDADMRGELGLDSLDFLSLVEELSKQTGWRIDEDDYPQLATLGSSITFLARH